MLAWLFSAQTLSPAVAPRGQLGQLITPSPYHPVQQQRPSAAMASLQAELEGLAYRELQHRAKEAGVKATG